MKTKFLQPGFLPQSMCCMLLIVVYCQDCRAEHLSSTISKAAVPVKQFDFEREQDLDFDRQPDNWTKRKGPGFHDYVTTEIVHDMAHDGTSSLCCTVDGSPMAMYSAPFRVDAEHSYVFEGYIKTEGLKYDAAVVTVSYLDERRHRIMRFVSDPITGTTGDWTHIQLPIMDPPESVYHAVVGCHLIHSQRGDVSGKVWFDSLSIGRLPRLTLQSNFANSFKQARAAIEVIAIASGLDTEYRYEMEIEIQDVRQETLASQKFFLKSSSVHPISFQNMSVTAEANEPIIWKRDPFPTGFYYVYASLLRDGDEILQRKTTFAVMELIDEVSPSGQFGWSIHQDTIEIDSQDFLDIASQSGIHFLKLPLWKSAFSPEASQKGRLLSELSERHIEPIGVLEKPPLEHKLYDKNNWNGILDVFSLPPKYWADKVHHVLALYSSPIRRWQLGSDDDTSFLGHPQLNETLGAIRKEFDRIGRETVLGVQWKADVPVSNTTEYGRSFITFSTEMDSDLNQLVSSVETAKRIGFDAFISLKMKSDLEAGKDDYLSRSIALIKRLVDLRRMNISKLIFEDVINDHTGLLRENGSPTELYLPWRTTALALADSHYVGSITMPQGSTNHIFTKNGKAIFVLWNEQELTESIYLGDGISMLNSWGERSKPAQDSQTGQQLIPVGPNPVFLMDCSMELVNWRQATELAIGKVASSANEHEDSIRFYNCFKRMVSGQVSLHASDWTLTVPNSSFQLSPEEHAEIPFYIQLPSIARLGDQQFAIEFDLSTAEISHPFRVYLDYQVGVGDLTMQVLLTETSEGHWLLEQRIENRTDPPETMNFRCEVFVRGRRRQVRSIDGLFSGQEIKRTFLISNPGDLREREIWVRAQQTNGRRVLNEVIDESKIDDLIEQSRLLMLEEALTQ